MNLSKQQTLYILFGAFAIGIITLLLTYITKKNNTYLHKLIGLLTIISIICIILSVSYLFICKREGR